MRSSLREWRMLNFALLVRLRHVILLFGIVNAALYSALLPLWEGFDEAFHYAYVETLWQTKRLPVLGRTAIPNDVAQSLRLAPVSHVVQRSLAETTSFAEWFGLPQAEKERRRRALEGLRPQPASGSRPNYQAHHPPLAYVLLMPLDWGISKAPITVRVLALRLFEAILSVVLVWLGAVALCGIAEMPERFANAALFTIFCSQMLYATIAHVAKRRTGDRNRRGVPGGARAADPTTRMAVHMAQRAVACGRASHQSVFSGFRPAGPGGGRRAGLASPCAGQDGAGRRAADSGVGGSVVPAQPGSLPQSQRNPRGVRRHWSEAGACGGAAHRLGGDCRFSRARLTVDRE